MPVAAHLEALRPGFTTYFKRAIQGLSNVDQIQLLGNELKEAFQMLVSEQLSDWDAVHDCTSRLSEEVLALCFTLLPLQGRVFASHVSRRWRSISLNNPAIWASIDSDIPIRYRPELLAMVLERTGKHPVDVFECPDQQSVEGLLVDHIHHIRSLFYHRVVHSAPLSCPAPHLETLICELPVTIGADFLGGTVGRLRVVEFRTVSFPETCPALSTVTALFLRGPISMHEAMHFNLLFQLFPVLQSLTLKCLERRVAAALPAGPIPVSLRYLDLSTIDPDYDLMPLYATWRSDALSHVEITHGAVLSNDVVHLVEGAHTIDVLYDAGVDTAIITVAGPGSRFRRSLEYWQRKADQRDLAAHLLEIPSTLRCVRAMSVPASSLEPFLAVFAILPELVRLTLTINASGAPPEDESRWDVLAPLARLEHRGNLQSLVLHVDYFGAPCDPSAHDAEGLLAHLATLSHVPLPDISVTGFPPAILHELPPAAFSGFRVVFGSTDEPTVAHA